MKVALLTCEKLAGYIAYEEHLDLALEKAGVAFEWIVWTDWQQVDWSQFDGVLIRTTWDYQQNIETFLLALEEISQKTKLFNDIETVKWNSSKDYLFDYGDSETRPVLSREVSVKSEEEILALLNEQESKSLIIKPFISASAHNTFHVTKDNVSQLSPAIIEANSHKRMMVQPFLENILTEGEYSFHFFGGQFSHGILKTPKSGDFRSQEEYGSFVRTIVPDEEMRTFSKKVLEKTNRDLLYARVDFVRNGANFNLMELECIEPSLYFAYGEGSADRLVEALVTKIQRS